MKRNDDSMVGWVNTGESHHRIGQVDLRVTLPRVREVPR